MCGTIQTCESSPSKILAGASSLLTVVPLTPFANSTARQTIAERKILIVGGCWIFLGSTVVLLLSGRKRWDDATSLLDEMESNIHR